MTRLLFWLLLGWLLWRLGWRWYRRQLLEQGRRPAAEAPVDQFVPCALCGVHVPRRDALEGLGDKPAWYCSEEHRRRHLSDQG
jgi:hypothetical protein